MQVPEVVQEIRESVSQINLRFGIKILSNCLQEEKKKSSTQVSMVGLLITLIIFNHVRGSQCRIGIS